MPRALVTTFALLSILALALAALLTRPGSTVKPLRAAVVDLDEPGDAVR
jgi:hypothetical protein